MLKYSGYRIGSSATRCASWFSPIVSCLMFCAWTISIRYKYRLYFTDTLLICANSTVFCGSASNWGVTYFENPLIIQHGTPIKIDQVVHSSETIMLDAWRSPKTNLFLCNIVMAFSILLKIAPGRVVGWPYALCMVMPSTNIRKLWRHQYDHVGILGAVGHEGDSLGQVDWCKHIKNQ